MKTLEKETGLGFFEIPGLPPSIPGLRLKHAFEKKLSQQHVTFLSKAVIKSSHFENHRFTVEAENQNMINRIQAKGVILATGRFSGGGLHAKRDVIHETVFNLPVFQPEHRNKWHQLDFFDQKGHMINQAGLEPDSFFRPVDSADNPAFQHLYAIGSILAHNDWVRLKCGSGVSSVSAFTAVNHFYDTHIKGSHV